MRAKDVELGFLVQPDTEPRPGVVLIPDVRGIYEHFRELARRLAGEGYRVLAVDLYRREGPPNITDVASAMAWIRELPDPRVLEDLQAAVDFLRADAPDAPVGITGFCMGGQYAILAACTCTGISACVPFYGMLAYEAGLDPEKKPRAPLDAIPGLRCPLLGLYGAEDPLIPLDQVTALESALAKTGQAYEVHVYPGAGHAFLNDAQPERYRPEAAADAWSRMLGFFKARLA